MNLREWALIVFTILTQLAVGTFVVLGVIHFFALRKYGTEEADRLSDRALFAIGPVIVLSLLVSLMHLGNPLNAPRAVSNLDSSWLSREVLFSVLFTIVGAVFAFMQWRKIASFAVRNVIAWIAALIGLALIFSMSQIYMLPTQPSWNTVATPISFFTTTLLLGVLAIGAALVANYAYVKRKNPECADTQCILLRSTVRWIAIAAVALLGIELIVTPLLITYLANGPAAADASLSMLYNQYAVIFALRLVLVFIGAGILAVLLYQYAMTPGREKTLGYLAYAAFALVLVSEVLGRFLFYATHMRIGI